MNPSEVSEDFGAKLSRWMTVRCLNQKPKTVAFYNQLHAAIRKAVPDLSQPTNAITEDWILAFAERLKHFCPTRWNAVVAAVKTITPHKELLKRRADKSRHFTPPSKAQYEALISECDDAPRSRAGDVARFLSMTGLRITEARALRWENIRGKTIEVITETKFDKRRVVPFVPGLKKVLDRLRRLDNDGYVLPRANPRKAIETASKRVMGKAWSFHCFRHLYATRCIESGVDMPTVARWLGHADGGALLAKRYYHLVDDHSRSMAARVRI